MAQWNTSQHSEGRHLIQNEIWGFHIGDDEDSSLLGCYADEWAATPWRMDAERSSEIAVTIYRLARCNNKADFNIPTPDNF